mmetsp:Transcript_143618/g.203131  ORF Transcript_143618/g.203131 Transcript_143618/m.203131 type:complete len:263 (-) Transcript_143618:382-1170(-)
MAAMATMTTMTTMATAMVLRAVLIMAVAIAMTIVSTVALMATISTVSMSFLFLLYFLLLDLDVLLDEIDDIVGANVAKLRHLDSAFHCRHDLRILVDVPDLILDANGLIRRDQVQLVEDDLIRKCNLLECLVYLALLDGVIEAAPKVLRIRYGDDGIKSKIARNLWAGHEGPDDGDRICHPRRLDHDLVDLFALLEIIQDLLQPTEKVSTDGAAHAAVVHDHDLLSQGQLLLLQQGIVDGHLAKLVLDNGDLLFPLLLKDIV